ncbi:helix-turn-helix transcriptional regulator [Aestuariimicrobium sp. p3-SID1156]|uniref:helix-turn-helix domain-containing protein n=1 Tax=Aestuariimicrobium sp. p3-SID1156 TaxID=2916038 RepID=UPI00223BDB27|nr:helix-turn-helix transcriptional regulator [Aestuariimicrobium sp. p3-SID1156]MCT1459910.1 helix-turn-helix transcriptional regulator [Aestuariimicrobium sp. p3-SID1156]
MSTTHPTLTVRWDVVKALRETKDLDDDTSLAIAMGIDRSTISRVFNGKSQPGPRFQAALCVALNAKLDHLFKVVPATKDAA